jgi:hypothetical protein
MLQVMDFPWQTATTVIILWVVLLCAGVLVLYGIVRTGVAAGLRDHVKWLEKKRVKESRSAASVYPPITPDAAPEG